MYYSLKRNNIKSTPRTNNALSVKNLEMEHKRIPLETLCLVHRTSYTIELALQNPIHKNLQHFGQYNLCLPYFTIFIPISTITSTKSINYWCILFKYGLYGLQPTLFRTSYLSFFKTIAASLARNLCDVTIPMQCGETPHAILILYIVHATIYYGCVVLIEQQQQKKGDKTSTYYIRYGNRFSFGKVVPSICKCYNVFWKDLIRMQSSW